MAETAHRGNHKWLIDEATLPKFKAAKCGEQFKSVEFEIGPEIKWHLEAYPDGRLESDAGNCQIYLVVSSFPSHITNIIIYYQLHCIPTISHFSGIKTFTKPNESTVWFRGVLPNEELKNLPSTLKTLQFECSINILRIESKDSITFEYPLNIDFQKQSQFVLDWKIKDNMLKQFKEAQHGKFLSNNIIHDGLFSLQCAPNGYRNNDHGAVRLFMQLCALPKGIKSIHLTRKLECMERHVEKETTKDLPWGYAKIADDGSKMRQNSGWGRAALVRRDVSHLDEINFRVTINILGYTTMDGQKVDIVSKNSKKRKRSPPPPKDAVEETETKDAVDTPAKDGKKPPKKKRKTSVKKKRTRAVKSDKDEMNVDDGDGEEEKVPSVKKIAADTKMSGEYEWQISNDLLHQFKSAKYRKFWKSPEFIVGDLKWCIEIWPSGHNKSDKESKAVVVFLTMVSILHDDIGKMSVCYTLYNKPSGASYSCIKEFTAQNNSFGMCGGILKQKELKELKNTFKDKVVFGARLTILNTMDGKDMKAKIYKQIYPLRIKNNEDGVTGDDSECFNRKCKFEWKIEGDLMNKFKKVENGQCFESTMFNGNMWSLRCAPNGIYTDSEGEVDLWLQLNSFPKGIGKMKVNFELKCLETKTRGLYVHTFNMTKSVAGWNNVLKTEDIQGLDELTFVAFVEIQMFYDTKNKRIKAL